MAKKRFDYRTSLRKMNLSQLKEAETKAYSELSTAIILDNSDDSFKAQRKLTYIKSRIDKLQQDANSEFSNLMNERSELLNELRVSEEIGDISNAIFVQDKLVELNHKLLDLAN